MTQLISSLTYNAIGPKSNKGIATLILDPTIDLVWQVKLLGAVQGSSENVNPKWVSVDNIAGAVGITTKLGFYAYQTPPFQRETSFVIPDGMQECTFTFELGAITPVTVYISEDKIADSMSNQLLVQQTAAKTLVYQFVNVTATQNQQLNSGNSQINFVPVVAAITYNLLDIAGAPVDNGFLQFVQNTGAFPVTLLPFGAQTINAGVSNPNLIGWNAGRPMVLNPGDSGILTSDGSNWFYRGDVTFDSPEIPLTDSLVMIANHGLGKIPDTIVFIMRCKIAQSGWAVGDEAYPAAILEDGSNQSNAIASLTPLALTFINPQLTTFPPFFVNKATGAKFSVTPANWRIVVRLQATW